MSELAFQGLTTNMMPHLTFPHFASVALYIISQQANWQQIS